MNATEQGLSSSDFSQTKGNLRLATQFIREYLDDPERYGPIPLGAAVVLLPPEDQANDPELRLANLQMAEQMAAEGRTVVLWTVGGEQSAPSQMIMSQIAVAED